MNQNTDQPFVAINFIDCDDDYKQRFEELFSTRAKAIDTMPGFKNMEVLKPSDNSNGYLIVSHWNSEADFKQWTSSPEFIEGHKRGFADMAKAKQEGKKTPMHSTFKTYTVLTR